MIKQSISLFVAAMFFISCSSSPSTQPQVDANAALQNKALINFNSDTSKQDQPRALSPLPQQDKFHLPSSSGNDAAASAAVVGAAILLAQIIKVEEKREDIRGTCLYGEEDQPLTHSPCINVTAELLDEKHQSQIKTTTNENGHFRFYAPAGKSYFIKLSDRKNRISILNKPIRRGHTVLLMLQP